MSELANLLQVWTTDPRTASLTISMMYFPYDSFLAIHLLEFETVVVVSDLTKCVTSWVRDARPASTWGSRESSALGLILASSQVQSNIYLLPEHGCLQIPNIYWTLSVLLASADRLGAVHRKAVLLPSWILTTSTCRMLVEATA